MFLCTRNMTFVASAVLCSMLFTGCHRTSSTNAPTPVVLQPSETNPPLPPTKANGDMGWTLASDQHLRLADYRDKIVVLDFYATWCEPCRVSTPHLVELQERYGPKGLQVVGLNVGGQEDYAEVPAFAREFHIPYQLGIPDEELENLYIGDNGAIPQTFVLDRAGRLVRRFVGYDDSVGDKLEEAIQKALNSTEGEQSGQ